MSEERNRSYGWADDIVAPRQEFDTLATLDQEASIQAELANHPGLTPQQLVDKYKILRKAYRDERQGDGANGTPPSTKGGPIAGEEKLIKQEERRIADLVEKVTLFGAQASARARQGSSDRIVISFSCPDRPGVVAAAAVAMAESGGNIEGAFMSVVARQLVIAFLLSGPAAEATEELEARVSRSLEGVTGVREFGLAVVPMEAGKIEWPKPRSTYWHLSARLSGDDDLLLAVTDVIAKHELPLVALSSWVEDLSDEVGGQIQVVDLNFAVAAPLEAERAALVRGVLGGLSEGLPNVQLGIAPVDWPTRGQPQGDVVGADVGDLVLTVLGHARPGFVHNVVKATQGALGRSSEVRGSSMAILEGISVLTLVVPRPEGGPSSARRLEANIQDSIKSALYTAGLEPPVAELRVLQAGERARIGADSDEEFAQERPTHELRLQVVEQPWVLAKVARVLAKLGVNITWLVSYVLEPMIGQSWPRCALEMHIHVEDEKRSEVDAALRSLANAEGWGNVSLRPWSLTRDTEH